MSQKPQKLPRKKTIKNCFWIVLGVAESKLDEETTKKRWNVSQSTKFYLVLEVLRGFPKVVLRSKNPSLNRNLRSFKTFRQKTPSWQINLRKFPRKFCFPSLHLYVQTNCIKTSSTLENTDTLRKKSPQKCHVFCKRKTKAERKNVETRTICSSLIKSLHFLLEHSKNKKKDVDRAFLFQLKLQNTKHSYIDILVSLQALKNSTTELKIFLSKSLFILNCFKKFHTYRS